MLRKNRHRGSSLDRFLKGQGMYEDVQAKALKRAIAEAITDGNARAGLSKLALAKRNRKAA